MTNLELMTDVLADVLAKLGPVPNRVETFKKTLESYARFAVSEWQLSQIQGVSGDMAEVERIRQESKN